MTVKFESTFVPKGIGPGKGLVVRSFEGRVGFYSHFFKRVFDVLLVGLSLPIVVPLIALFALAVALDGRNPFYWQPRIGKNGRIFFMMKLRTMVPHADATLEAYLASNPDARLEWYIKQKLTHDPRITRIGHALRKSSMDELPQLWNVLKGDMSLVGPRPMMTGQDQLYPRMDIYTRMRPGITGLWQVSDRNHCTFADRAKFDIAYLDAMSFKTDIHLLMRTVGVVFRATGC